MTVTELSPSPAREPGGRGFYKPKGVGVLGLGPVGTAIAGAAAFLMVLAILSPFPVLGPVVIFLVTGLFLFLGSVPDRYGKTWMWRHTRRRTWRKGARRGLNTYLPGGLTHMGAHKLPGVLASSELHAYTTADQREFAVLRYPRSHYYAVSARAHPDGASLLDEADIARQVENYGHWLASLALEPDFVQGMVSIETAPNSGPLMRQAVEAGRSSRAHSLSKRIMGDILDQYPQGSSGAHATITATFKAPAPEMGLDGKKVKRRDRVEEAEQVGQLLAVRLPHLLKDLPDCGSGHVVPLTCDDLIERVRVAYNPADRDIYDDARARGQSRPVSLWTSAGPAGHVDHWNWYQHGGGGSITWEFTGFTTEPILADSLLPLLEAGGKDFTTRITIIYQPMDPARAAHVVESNHKAASARVRDAKKPTAHQDRVVQNADHARRSQAKGHALLDVAVLVTATVRDPETQLPRVKAAVQRLGPNARLHLRPTDGLHPAAFAQGLGVLGLVTDRHLRLPRGLMNGI